ncbi:MAG: hypothetical protein JWO84_807 [Parcubacteria group bacterium]|nr:hypothetical protein [Parcubacteria group bacterium]
MHTAHTLGMFSRTPKLLLQLGVAAVVLVPAAGLAWYGSTQRTHIPSAYIPAGWAVIASSTADVNTDGYSDTAFVLEKGPHTTNLPGTPEALQEHPRKLLILLGSKQGYSISVSSDTAILRADQGGAFGDPFDSIELSAGKFEMFYYSGSAYRWSEDYTFSLDSNIWKLTSYDFLTYSTLDPEGENCDYNKEDQYDYIAHTVSHYCGASRKLMSVDKDPSPTVDLRDFNIATWGGFEG